MWCGVYLMEYKETKTSSINDSCINSEKMFVDEIDDLPDDCSEGSINERLIFTDVFFGNDHDIVSQKDVMGVGNFEFNDSNILLCPNREISVLTGQVDSNNRMEYTQLYSAPVHFCEGHGLFMMNNNSASGKRIKLSVNELSSKNLSRLADKATTPCEKVSVSPSVTCRLVESSKQQVTSSCYLLKRRSECISGNETRCRDVAKCRRLNSNSDKGKEIIGVNTVASPVSQESSATKLLNASPYVTTVSRLISEECAEEKLKPSNIDEGSVVTMSLSKDIMKDPRPLLRNYIQKLLRALGWEVGRRNRDDKIRGEYLYLSPWGGRPIRQFRRVWILCGQTLFAATKSFVHEGSKQWIGLSHFWSDLSDTISKIEDELINQETTVALAQQWYLLDPFANVVFIDKKLSVLRAGKVVTVKRSPVIDASRGSGDVLLLKDANTEEMQPERTADFRKSRRWSVGALKMVSHKFPKQSHKHLAKTVSGNKSSGHHQARGSDGTCINSSNSLFEVPIMSGDESIARGESNSGFVHEQPAYFSNCHPYRFDHDEEIGRSGPSTSLETERLGINIHNIQIEPVGAEEWFMTSSGRIRKSCKKTDVEKYDTGTLLQYKPEGRVQVVTSKKSENRIINGNKRLSTDQPKNDDKLVSAILKRKTFGSTNKRSTEKTKSGTPRNNKSQKGSCRLLPRKWGNNGKHTEGKWLISGVSTLFSWLIDSGVVSLYEVIHYRNLDDETLVKAGLVTRNGILCSCCNEVLSISRFKVHAGFRLNPPCLNLFMESGKPFIQCQLEAWSAEYKARKNATRTILFNFTDSNDSSCGLCGDGGDLICCDNCPSTFHQECLCSPELPEGSWYCQFCTCKVCGQVVNDKEPSKSLGALKCKQCEHKYHDTCLKEKDSCKEEASGMGFCSKSCQMVYLGLDSYVGFVNILCDGFSCTLLRCIHGDQSVHSRQSFVPFMAECNTKLAVALTIMEECFLSMVDPRTGIDMIPHVLYNWGSEFVRLNFTGFYTLVLEKDDVMISVASIRIHGVTVAEMPLIATSSKFRRLGMCRRLVNSIEEMLKSLKVEKLVISAIPSLVDTWVNGFGFELLGDVEKKSLSEFNLMVLPGTVWLKKRILSEDEEAKDDEEGGETLV